jgi:hypothetical protein
MAGKAIVAIAVGATLVVALAGCLGVGGRLATTTVMVRDNGATPLSPINSSIAVVIPSSAMPATPPLGHKDER